MKKIGLKLVNLTKSRVFKEIKNIVLDKMNKWDISTDRANEIINYFSHNSDSLKTKENLICWRKLMDSEYWHQIIIRGVKIRLWIPLRQLQSKTEKW